VRCATTRRPVAVADGQKTLGHGRESAPQATLRHARGLLAEGYSLHADLAVGHKETRKLERLLRYGLRPPFAQKRLSLTSDGKVRLQLRKPYYTGQTEIVLPPQDFLRRLIATIPPKRMNVVRLPGVFAPRATARSSPAGPIAQEAAAKPRMTALPGAHRPHSRRRSPCSPLPSPRSPRPKTSPRRATADPGTSCSSASSTSISSADAAAPGCTTLATSKIPRSSTRSSVTSVCPPRCRRAPARAAPQDERSILPTSTSPKRTTSGLLRRLIPTSRLLGSRGEPSRACLCLRPILFRIFRALAYDEKPELLAPGATALVCPSRTTRPSGRKPLPFGLPRPSAATKDGFAVPDQAQCSEDTRIVFAQPAVSCRHP
jgi:hypothetical protein